MKTTIDKAGRVVIPAPARTKVGFRPGDELEVAVEEYSIRISRTGPGPRLVRRGKRWVARPTVSPKDRPSVDVAELVEEERNRWPW